MKKLFCVSLLSLTGFVLSAWTPCGQGNDAAYDVDTGEDLMCCSLGEDSGGTLLSCTNGSEWGHYRPVE
ncbi:MAG: hypothetical protein QNK37_14945 [Acidobacteriota bacterium]|nr:hypothetical protein [Acidobacteriota bacterium]